MTKKRDIVTLNKLGVVKGESGNLSIMLKEGREVSEYFKFSTSDLQDHIKPLSSKIE